MKEKNVLLYVDIALLMERDAIEAGGNYIRRKAILGSAETIYAAK